MAVSTKVVFNSADSMLKHLCDYTDTKPAINKMMPAEVLYIVRNEEGNLALGLRVAMNNEIVEITSLAADPNAKIKPGDLVAFFPSVYVPTIDSPDSGRLDVPYAHAWMGLVWGKLDMSYDFATGEYGFSEKYEKPKK